MKATNRKIVGSGTRFNYAHKQHLIRNDTQQSNIPKKKIATIS